MIELSAILRNLMAGAKVKEYDTKDGWHVVKYASGWVELTGMLGVDYSATTSSYSTGFHCRTGTVTLPVTLDTSRNRVAMAMDSSPGLNVFKTQLSASGDKLTLTTGQVTASSQALPGYLTSFHVAGYEKG